jgi:hypothetical protein
MSKTIVQCVDKETVVRLWLHRQGLSTPRGHLRLSKRRLSEHLVRTGALQLDPINVVDRAHYLTLWSRFGPYTRHHVDEWVYRDRIGYEYWGHEASILPLEHLPCGLRRMRSFPPKSWRARAWWSVYATSSDSKRRVLRRLREHGPLESADFEKQPAERLGRVTPGRWTLSKEDRRSLRLLWHDGRVAVKTRRHFRRVFDLAERIYPVVEPATTTAFEDSWLLTGLSGNGIATERHLTGYITGPNLSAEARRRVLTRNLRTGRVVEVQVPNVRGPFYGLAEQVEDLASLPDPTGTTLICPFDSFLWQRQRARDLLGFTYRIEIYVPPAKRKFGYYALPILHNGSLVGRLDPKLSREHDVLDIKSLQLEPGVKRSAGLTRGLGEAIESLAEFVGARRVTLPRGWGQLV